MCDIKRLEKYLTSDDAPENCIQISDLDGFLTGIVCSPDLIRPCEWFPVVWNTPNPSLSKEGVWATQEILILYIETAQALNNVPSHLEPLFWKCVDDSFAATDWCEGFMSAFDMRDDRWSELIETEQGRDWMFPILAHLVDDDGTSLIGAVHEDLPKVQAMASQRIPHVVPEIFAYWQSKQSPRNSLRYYVHEERPLNATRNDFRHATRCANQVSGESGGQVRFKHHCSTPVCEHLDVRTYRELAYSELARPNKRGYPVIEAR